MDAGLTGLVEQLPEAFCRDDVDAMARVPERDNLACLREFFSALARGDYDAAHALLVDDPAYSIAAGAPIRFQMSGRGRTEVQQGLRANFSSVAFDSVEIHTLAAQGDVIVVLGRQRGRWLASGVPFDEFAALRYGFRNGKLASYNGWFQPFPS